MVCAICCSGRVEAFVALSVPPTVWPDGTVLFDLQLPGPSRILIDGNTSWEPIAKSALQAWNPYMGTLAFDVYEQSPGPPAYTDKTNQVFFAADVYGEEFGEYVLAVTTLRSSLAKRWESDIIFNSTKQWDSFRGGLRGSTYDFYRVALHEFGHSVGLGHPDEQQNYVSAIMNSVVSDLESLTSDDIRGAQILYPFPPPNILTQPQSQTVHAGDNVTFSVVVDPLPVPGYQWRRNGQPLAGATSSSLVLSDVQTNHAGWYTVLVTNSHSSIISQVAVLTVKPPLPTILTQPLSQTSPVGAPVSFFVSASGVPPLSYQWRLNGQNLLRATNAGYQISSVQMNQAGAYTVLVTNSGGSVLSEAASLVVGLPPSITTQPKSKTVKAGLGVTLSVSVSGSSPLSYQWSRNSQPVIGATNINFSVLATLPVDAGEYRVKVTNPFGTTESAAVTLIVQYAPTITVQPQGQTVALGQPVNLSVVGAGVPSPTYQWRFGGARITGATSSAYTIAHFHPTNSGAYSVALANSLGSIISSNALVTSGTPPVIILSPESRTNVAGESTSFVLNAAPTNSLYQWYFNGSPIQNGTNSALTINPVTRSDAGNYRVQVTNTFGAAESTATLWVLLPQRISSTTRLPEGITQFTFRASDGLAFQQELPTFEAQYSSNFVQWIMVNQPIIWTNGEFMVRDNSGFNSPFRFYRIIQHY